jgi:hypothetical protein
MLRGRFLNGLFKPLFPEKKPLGDSSRWGDLSADLRTKLPESGRVERLRQKESRGNCPLVVAADTGLTSGVMSAMIGARLDGSQDKLHSNAAACAVVQPRYRHNVRGVRAARRCEIGFAG